MTESYRSWWTGSTEPSLGLSKETRRCSSSCYSRRRCLHSRKAKALWHSSPNCSWMCSHRSPTCSSSFSSLHLLRSFELRFSLFWWFFLRSLGFTGIVFFFKKKGFLRFLINCQVLPDVFNSIFLFLKIPPRISGILCFRFFNSLKALRRFFLHWRLRSFPWFLRSNLISFPPRLQVKIRN